MTYWDIVLNGATIGWGQTNLVPLVGCWVVVPVHWFTQQDRQNLGAQRFFIDLVEIDLHANSYRVLVLDEETIKAGRPEFVP